ncbi:hypothetical protein [Pseudarthrobacter sp. WHRI 8279]|uniref:hypothetical protein n=1 Tax=Pseudarthrobacter sp. WHRI 8279 TaxID=3162566 RepID=UPI0032EFA0FE
MGKETAFWEAALAVAPLLGLTIIVEFRALPWSRILPALRTLLLGYMLVSMILLFSTVGYSTLKLLSWGSAQPVIKENTEDAPLVAAGIIFAAAGVLLVPVSTTFIVALGPAINPHFRQLRSRERATQRAFERRIEALLGSRHEARVELAERVLANTGRLFSPSQEGGRLTIKDPAIAALRQRSLGLHGRIKSTEMAYVKWEKASLKRLKKARRRLTLDKYSDYIAHRPRDIASRSPRSHVSPYHHPLRRTR